MTSNKEEATRKYLERVHSQGKSLKLNQKEIEHAEKLASLSSCSQIKNTCQTKQITEIDEKLNTCESREAKDSANIEQKQEEIQEKFSTLTISD